MICQLTPCVDFVRTLSFPYCCLCSCLQFPHGEYFWICPTWHALHGGDDVSHLTPHRQFGTSGFRRKFHIASLMHYDIVYILGRLCDCSVFLYSVDNMLFFNEVIKHKNMSVWTISQPLNVPVQRQCVLKHSSSSFLNIGTPRRHPTKTKSRTTSHRDKLRCGLLGWRRNHHCMFLHKWPVCYITSWHFAGTVQMFTTFYPKFKRATLMISVCVRSFLPASGFCHLCSMQVLMALSSRTAFSKIWFGFIYLFLHLNCFGTLSCHHVALMWFLSGSHSHHH